MSSYSFKVTINAKDIATLTAGGYVFSASKSVGAVGGSGTQWITTPILAANINVSWDEDYSLYFTQTAIVNGATIEQDNTCPAYTGKSYIYKNANFQEDTKYCPTGSIVITNDEPVQANFGLSQSAVIGGNAEQSPLIIVPVIQNGGSCTFTPSETITIGFSKTYTSPGVIASVESSTTTFTLTAGSSQHWNYDNGVWTQAPNAVFTELAHAEAKFWRYLISLTASVGVSLFTAWLQSRVSSGYSVSVTQASGANYQVVVSGASDPTAVIDALVGATVNASVRQTHANFTRTVTTSVKVVKVQNEPPTLVEHIWNTMKHHK